MSALVETAAKAEAEATLVPALTEEDEKKMEEEERSRIAQTWPPLQEIERLRKVRGVCDLPFPFSPCFRVV